MRKIVIFVFLVPMLLLNIVVNNTNIEISTIEVQNPEFGVPSPTDQLYEIAGDSDFDLYGFNEGSGYPGDPYIMDGDYISGALIFCSIT